MNSECEMSEQFLSDEEVNAVTTYLATPDSRFSGWGTYVAFVAPSLIFSIYGIFYVDPVALALAYIILVAIGVWFLSYSTQKTHHLISALRKYENEVQALKNS